MIVDDDALARTILKDYIRRTPKLELIAEGESAEKAVEMMMSGTRPDVLFLDVEMPNMTGIQFLQEFLQTHKPSPLVVLCTSNRDYAKDAFDVGAIDFLLKTVEYWRFLKAIGKVEEAIAVASGRITLATKVIGGQFSGSPGTNAGDGYDDELGEGESGPRPTGINQDFLFVKVDHNLHRVRLREVLWVEALQDYIILQVGKERKIVHMTMKGIESRLPSGMFVRVHRSYIVRIEAIDKIRSESLVIGEKTIPIGGTYREALFKTLNILS